MNSATDTQFGIGSVPITVAAKVYGHRESWVRAGIVGGWLPIGTATRDGKLITRLEEMEMPGRITYYISPKLLYEHTGYIWKGGEEI